MYGYRQRDLSRCLFLVGRPLLHTELQRGKFAEAHSPGTGWHKGNGLRPTPERRFRPTAATCDPWRPPRACSTQWGYLSAEPGIGPPHSLYAAWFGTFGEHQPLRCSRWALPALRSTASHAGTLRVPMSMYRVAYGRGRAAPDALPLPAPQIRTVWRLANERQVMQLLSFCGTRTE